MPSTETPSVITVRETQSHPVAADRADLRVTVEGASLFTGQEALKKAREVAALAADLSAAGLPPDAIFLEGVSADTQSWGAAKASRARYRLRLHCAELGKLADYVGVIASQKNASLTTLDWGYPTDDAQADQWLLDRIGRVNDKAAKIAAALGVKLLGVHMFTENLLDPEAKRPTPSGGDDRERASAMHRMTGPDLGLEVSHTKTITVSVEAQFLVSGYR